MNTEDAKRIQECTRGALTGQLVFPEIVDRLARLGVERYHADYSRQEITYYFADGDSIVVDAPHPDQETAVAFSPFDVEAAVHMSQRNEHSYLDFVRKSMKAGCVGYFVQITGRRVIYFGRNGESHVEHFPPASVDAATT